MTDPKPSKRKPRRTRGRVRRRIKSAGILPATLMVLLTLLAGAIFIWIVFTRLLRDAWPWQLGGLETNTPGFQLMQLVLTLIGGIGAAILVVVAYRRQRDLETARFDDRFAAAATQLGADTAAERLAGVYAMAALADTWVQHRQQCINVLCAYLRLPYDPNEGLLADVVKERAWPVGELDEDGRGATEKETRTYRSLPNDREVRHTIVRVITDHLRDTATTSWRGLDFDFTGAVFDGCDFSSAHFTDGKVLFNDVVISGRLARFDAVVFSGGEVSFDRAALSASLVRFDGAVFSGGEVSFVGAKFTGDLLWFERSVFSGGDVSFVGAKFTVNQLVRFIGAVFSGGKVSFGQAVFDSCEVYFVGLTLFGGTLSFTGATFTNAWVSFDGSQFSGAGVSFWQAEFSSSEVSFSGEFSGGAVSFDGAKFSGGQVSFGGEFSGGTVSFDKAKFSGGQVSFEGASFSDGEVSFDGASFSGDGTVRMPPHDPTWHGRPTRNGLPFYGWPTPDKTERASGDELPPVGPVGT